MTAHATRLALGIGANTAMFTPWTQEKPQDHALSLWRYFDARNAADQFQGLLWPGKSHFSPLRAEANDRS